MINLKIKCWSCVAFKVLLQPHLTLSVARLSPQGVLRIHFIEAQDLLGKDKFLGGLIKGKSDPYGVIKVGTQLFQSKVIQETVNPRWNEVYEVGGRKNLRFYILQFYFNFGLMLESDTESMYMDLIKIIILSKYLTMQLNLNLNDFPPQLSHVFYIIL